MRQIFFTSPHRAEVLQVERPALGPGQALVHTLVSAISAGTELTYYRGTNPLLAGSRWGRQDYPFAPGYANVGLVEEVGPAVSVLKPGDRVLTLSPHAEYVAADAAGDGSAVHGLPQSIARLPKGVSEEEAAFAILGMTTAHAVRRAAIELGDNVLVIGAGVVGLLAMQQARNAGAGRVFVTDTNDLRLRVALGLGATLAINPRLEDPAAAMAPLTEGGPDVVIEAAGTPGAFDAALALARDRGRVVILGFHTKAVSFVPGEDLFRKELTILGTRAVGAPPGLPAPYVRWTAERTMEFALREVAEGRLRGAPMITHRVPPEEAPALYAELARGNPDILQAIFTW